MTTKRVVAAAMLAVLVLVAGCGDDGDDGDETPGTAQLPNPASVYCEEQGGEVVIVTADDGSQSGICRLPDGTEVDEWEYYREHNP